MAKRAFYRYLFIQSYSREENEKFYLHYQNFILFGDILIITRLSIIHNVISVTFQT